MDIEIYVPTPIFWIGGTILTLIILSIVYNLIFYRKKFHFIENKV